MWIDKQRFRRVRGWFKNGRIVQNFVAHEFLPRFDVVSSKLFVQQRMQTKRLSPSFLEHASADKLAWFSSGCSLLHPGKQEKEKQGEFKRLLTGGSFDFAVDQNVNWLDSGSPPMTLQKLSRSAEEKNTLKLTTYNASRVPLMRKKPCHLPT